MNIDDNGEGTGGRKVRNTLEQGKRKINTYRRRLNLNYWGGGGKRVNLELMFFANLSFTPTNV
jgi:hypothetical protein